MDESLIYYLCWMLPFVFGVAMATFAFGVFMGWLLWSHFPAKTRAVEAQNVRLRNEIRRLTA